MLRGKRTLKVYLCAAVLALIVFIVAANHGGFREKYYVDYEVPEDALFARVNDFEVDQHALTARSDDPWLEVEFPRERYHGIRIAVSDQSVPSANCVVYYCLGESEGYAEERSVSGALTPDNLSLLLPDVEIDRARLDLTDQRDVRMTLDRVTLEKIETRFSISQFIGSLVWVLLMLLPVTMLLVKRTISRREKR